MFLLDRNYIRSFDWISFLLTNMLAAIGLLAVFSATYKPEMPFSIFFKKQLLGIITGLVIYAVFCAIDFRTLMRWGYFGYFGVVILLIFTILKGSVAMGGQRWISLGFIKLQPSELTKLLFPAFATYYLSIENHHNKPPFRDFIPVLIMLGISFILVRKQPDLGTALLLAFTGLILVWFAGIPKKFFIISGLAILITAPLLWQALKPYQKQRVLVFMGYGDTHKERYQIEQSKIAIGSGGLFGKGFLKGTQNRLNFLPESRTDFIFSVIAEEWGFIGTMTVLLLYLFLFARLFYIIATITSPSVQMLAIGIISPLVLSTIINIGMVIGLLPVVGIPLPLVSYGLSNLWVTFASLGW